MTVSNRHCTSCRRLTATTCMDVFVVCGLPQVFTPPVTEHRQIKYPLCLFINLFMAYLTMLSVAQTIQYWMTGRAVNNELERM
jgi:hypothetical protein